MKKARKNNGKGIRADIAAFVRRLREDSGAPMKQVASEVGVSLATLGAWERGTRFPSAENIERLADYYGIEPCRLLNGRCTVEE